MIEQDSKNGRDYYKEELLMSIAISLKRIADAIEGSPSKLSFVDHLSGALSDAIYDAVRK